MGALRRTYQRPERIAGEIPTRIDELHRATVYILVLDLKLDPSWGLLEQSSKLSSGGRQMVTYAAGAHCFQMHEYHNDDDHVPQVVESM